MEHLCDCVADAIADGNEDARPIIEMGLPEFEVGPGECCGSGFLVASAGERWVTAGTWPPQSATIEQRSLRRGGDCQEIGSAQYVTLSFHTCAPTGETGRASKERRDEFGKRMSDTEARVWGRLMCCLPEIADKFVAKVSLNRLIPMPADGGCGGFRLMFTVEVPGCCFEEGDA